MGHGWPTDPRTFGPSHLQIFRSSDPSDLQIFRASDLGGAFGAIAPTEKRFVTMEGTASEHPIGDSFGAIAPTEKRFVTMEGTASEPTNR